MPKLQPIKNTSLAKGRVDGTDLEVLRRELYADGRIERPEADFLVELHSDATKVSPVPPKRR